MGGVKRRRLLTLIVSLVVAAVVLDGCGGGADSVSRSGSRAAATTVVDSARPTIVVEHGAFTDASGWDAVVGRLRRRGYDVLAPANPLRGVGADAAYLKSVLKTIDGPIVLVGHSYGGAVITNAAVGVPGVKALVYVAAVAPKKGESQMDIFARFPGSRLGPSTIVERKFPGGVDQYVKAESFRDVFSADLPAGRWRRRRRRSGRWRRSQGRRSPGRRRGERSRRGSWSPPRIMRSRRPRSASWPSVPTPTRSR